MSYSWAGQSVHDFFDVLERTAYIVGFLLLGTGVAIAANVAAGAIGSELLYGAGWKSENGAPIDSLESIAKDAALGTSIIMSVIFMLVTCITNCSTRKPSNIAKAGFITLACDTAISVGATAAGALLLNKNNDEIKYASASVATGMGLFAATGALIASCCYIRHKVSQHSSDTDAPNP
jgi:hypothetical protein